MYNPQKLHPISYVMSIFRAIKSNIVPIFIFVLFVMKDFDYQDVSNYIFPGILFVFFLITFIGDMIKTYKTRYWIENDHFVVTSGLFNLERKELNISRIQSMDTSQNMIHQIVGGVRLQIQTPSDGIALETVTKAQSDNIQKEIEKRKSDIHNTDNVGEGHISADSLESGSDTLNIHKEELLYRLSTQNLLLMAMTSGAIFVTFATLSPLLTALSEHLPWNQLYDQFETRLHGTSVFVVSIVAVIVMISYVVGTIITMIRYFNYTLNRQGEYLTIRYGLFKVQKVTVPIQRIQAVIEHRSFLRTLFGYTAYDFVITSDMSIDLDNDFADGRVMILPFIRRQEARQLLTDIVPSMKFHNVKLGLPWRGFHRRFWVLSLILIIIASVVHYYYWPWLWFGVAPIIIYMSLNSMIAVKKSGWAYSEDEMAIRRVTYTGFRTTYFKHDKVLGWERHAHPLMTRSDLSHFSYKLAKGSLYMDVGLKFVERCDVDALQAWYIGGGTYDDRW
ncbi:PH domain-containing protein [Staphylococcus sp. 17KM0847]|uniref:PH domain-containing protein n=1 Tax=Staphylococcus sp. 17KM0847 TaxID=2583989 RepID=UPI0015DD0C5A|nr:PH domain-containing protein [Staphylococcus sp. 17KM0847]QLK86487.1 hypothetical protein FGL66_07185 [Staphylococcus sp. 17KM0847]